MPIHVTYTISRKQVIQRSKRVESNRLDNTNANTVCWQKYLGFRGQQASYLLYRWMTDGIAWLGNAVRCRVDVEVQCLFLGFEISDCLINVCLSASVTFYWGFTSILTKLRHVVFVIWLFVEQTGSLVSYAAARCSSYLVSFLVSVSFLCLLMQSFLKDNCEIGFVCLRL